MAITRAIIADSKNLFLLMSQQELWTASQENLFLKHFAILASQGKCVFMVTHDIELASKTDRALILKDGKYLDKLLKPSADELYQALESSKD